MADSALQVTLEVPGMGSQALGIKEKLAMDAERFFGRNVHVVEVTEIKERGEADL